MTTTQELVQLMGAGQARVNNYQDCDDGSSNEGFSTRGKHSGLMFKEVAKQYVPQSLPPVSYYALNSNLVRTIINRSKSDPVD